VRQGLLLRIRQHCLCLARTCFRALSTVGASANPCVEGAPAGALRCTFGRDFNVQSIDVSCSTSDVIGLCVDEMLSGWDPPLAPGNRP